MLDRGGRQRVQDPGLAVDHPELAGQLLRHPPFRSLRCKGSLCSSQVVENWNSANQDIFYGKDGDLAGADKESVEVSALALHLLQAALTYVNTILVQRVLSDPAWQARLTDADRRGLSALFWTHVNLYGRFELDMNSHLDLGQTEQTG
jgi:hypothetical protein